MRIVAFIVVPCAIATIILGYMVVNEILPPNLYWIGIIPLVIGVGAFMIRRWVYETQIAKKPPRLSAKEIDILDRYFPYYRYLGSEHKIEFEKRVAVFRVQKKFQMRGADKVPGDIHLLMTASAIRLTMGFPYQKEFFPNLGMVVMFPRTFITPKINEAHHAIEFQEDEFDCLLIAVNMFVKGLQEPNGYYDSALYGFAKAFKKEHQIKDSDIPHERKELLVKLHLLRGFHIDNLGYVLKYTALPDFEVFEMCTEAFFLYPGRVQKELPKVFDYLVDIYQQDPRNYTSPAVQDVAYEEEEGDTELGEEAA
jgi:Mlc titration factor MtfA (ptsG expression regulator)